MQPRSRWRGAPGGPLAESTVEVRPDIAITWREGEGSLIVRDRLADLVAAIERVREVVMHARAVKPRGERLLVGYGGLRRLPVAVERVRLREWIGGVLLRPGA